MSTYNPNARNRKILESAMAHILSVPYAVPLRWVFYRLLQESLYTCKADYKKFISTTSKARKGFYNEWHPATLIDEGREVIESAEPNTRNQMLRLLPHMATLSPELFIGQDCVPFLIFEADTMSGQFEHFAPWADRAAFRGDSSVIHKWSIAKRCKELSGLYGLPVHVLYFGDYDPKGLQIPKSAMTDIWAWCDTEVEFTRCGINPGDESRFNLAEKIEKPGTYEWEALGHVDAGTLIRESLSAVVDVDAIEDAYTGNDDATDALRDEVEGVLADLLEDE